MKRLFISYCLAEMGRMAYLRFSFRILERIGLPGARNLVFMSQCLGIATGIIAIPSLIGKLEMEHLATGIMTSEIAAKMFISERTVSFHIGSMLKKAGCRNRTELISRVKS